jgi:hypothetical protein
LAVALTVLAGCSGSDRDQGPASAPVSTGPSAGGPSPTATVAPPSNGSATTGPPATRGPKSITFGPVTLHVPTGWDVAPGDATTAYVGVLAGGPADVNLRVMTDYAGAIDALQPTECLGKPPELPLRVEVLASGFAPVGRLTAEHRHWRFTCPGRESKTEDHRVWLLPVSRVAFVEQRHAPEVIDVVTTAEVA